MCTSAHNTCMPAVRSTQTLLQRAPVAVPERGRKYGSVSSLVQSQNSTHPGRPRAQVFRLLLANRWRRARPSAAFSKSFIHDQLTFNGWHSGFSHYLGFKSELRKRALVYCTGYFCRTAKSRIQTTCLPQRFLRVQSRLRYYADVRLLPTAADPRGGIQMSWAYPAEADSRLSVGLVAGILDLASTLGIMYQDTTRRPGVSVQMSVALTESGLAHRAVDGERLTISCSCSKLGAPDTRARPRRVRGRGRSRHRAACWTQASRWGSATWS